MNTSPSLIRAAMSGGVAIRRLAPVSGLPAGLQSRTGLPVVSNRAFLAAWAARRNRIIAAARLAKGHG